MLNTATCSVLGGRLISVRCAARVDPSAPDTPPCALLQASEQKACGLFSCTLLSRKFAVVPLHHASIARGDCLRTSGGSNGRHCVTLEYNYQQLERSNALLCIIMRLPNCSINLLVYPMKFRVDDLTPISEIGYVTHCLNCSWRPDSGVRAWLDTMISQRVLNPVRFFFSPEGHDQRMDCNQTGIMVHCYTLSAGIHPPHRSISDSGMDSKCQEVESDEEES